MVRHEWTLAALGALAVALILNAQALTDPTHTLPQDVGDPTLVAYLIAWGGHAILTDPSNLWHLNAFYPAPYGLAFSDSLLGYAPFGWLGSGPEAAILRYNIVFILAQALSLVGAYALARQLGPDRIVQLSINPNDVAVDWEDGSNIFWNQADLAALVARWQAGPQPVAAAGEGRIQVLNGAAVDEFLAVRGPLIEAAAG